MTCNHLLTAHKTNDGIEYFECRSCGFKFTPQRLQEIFTQMNAEIKQRREEVKQLRYQIGIMEANGGEFDG